MRIGFKNSRGIGCKGLEFLRVQGFKDLGFFRGFGRI